MGPNHSRSEDSGERESENDRANETDESSDRGRSRGQSSSRLVRKSVAEAHYGKEIDNPDQLAALQRLEQKYGRRVHTWLEEGMPMEAMGKPSKMEAFRQRKGTRVPWDIERQNDRSRRRNTSAIQRRRRERPDGDTQVPDSVRDVISSRGQSLEASVQRAMEDRMGESFDDVRVHTGPAAAQACESINARAFTVGNHVAFNRGEYDPESAEGQHVIAHELAHVRQQTDGAVSMLPQNNVKSEIDTNTKLESEAEGATQRVVEGRKLDIQRLSETHIYVQRHWKDQKRKNNGDFGELERGKKTDHPKSYLRTNRPKLPDEVVQKVWDDAKNVRDEIICPLTGQRLTWNKNKDRDDQWHMGHKPEFEYRYLVEYLLHGVITFEEFKKEYKNPEHYRPEAPNQDHEHEKEGEGWERKWGKL